MPFASCFGFFRLTHLELLYHCAFGDAQHFVRFCLHFLSRARPASATPEALKKATR
jgi:hypothetical protein